MFLVTNEKYGTLSMYVVLQQGIASCCLVNVNVVGWVALCVPPYTTYLDICCLQIGIQNFWTVQFLDPIWKLNIHQPVTHLPFEYRKILVFISSQSTFSVASSLSWTNSNTNATSWTDPFNNLLKLANWLADQRTLIILIGPKILTLARYIIPLRAKVVRR